MTAARALVDFAIAAVDFVRSETQRAKRSAVGAGTFMAMSIAGAMLVFLGFAAIMGAMYMALAAPDAFSPPVAALITGIVTIVIALAVLWISKRMTL